MSAKANLRHPMAVVLACGMTAGLAVPPAQAQDNDEEARELDRVEVTGSRISRVEMEQAHPVTSFDRSQLTEVDAPNIGEALQRLATENTGSPLNTAINNGGTGGVFLNLRGMGMGRTLVLINGHRTISADMQSIPTAMVERVDILKTGASAVYGVDAVAGVVNIITREGFTGAEAEASYQQYENVDGGGENWSASGIMGVDSARGHANLGFEHRQQEAIYQGDLDHPHMQNALRCVDLEAGCDTPTSPGIAQIGSPTTPQGSFTLADGRVVAPIEGTPGTDPDEHFLEDPDDTYNFAPDNFMQTPFETNNMFGHGRYELSPGLDIYADFRYTNRQSAQELAPYPYSSAFAPAGPLDNMEGEGIPESNAYNPFDQDVIGFARRLNEIDRHFRQNIDQFQTVLGLQGMVPGTTTWEFDLSYNFAQRNRTDIDEGQLIGSRLQSALGPSFVDEDGEFGEAGEVVCGTPDNPDEECVPLNLFGGEGSITDEMLDYVSKPLVDSIQSGQDIYNLTFTGDVLDLPAGPLSSAIGIEYRAEEQDSIPDSNKAVEGATGNVGDGVGGRQSVQSAFLESNIPLLAGQPAAESLMARFAYRHDDFSMRSRGGETGDFSNDSIELGLEWRPVEDLLVRATHAEVFTAPSVSNLYDPASDSFPQVADPCAAANWDDLGSDAQDACIAQGVPDGGVDNPNPQPRAALTGNPELGPESGETQTFGFVYSPQALEGFNLTVDYWEIDLEDAITREGVPAILDLCLERGGTGGRCDQIERAHPTNPGEISRVQDPLMNIGRETAEGIDVQANYAFDTQNAGHWSLGIDYSQLLTRESIRLIDGEPQAPDEKAGYYHQSDDATYPEHRANLRAGWTYGNIGVDAALQYIGAVTADSYQTVEGTQEIDAQQYLDLGLSYNTPFGSRVRFGVENATDEAPPWIEAGFNAHTDPSTYRTFGRSYTLRLSHMW